MSLRKRLPDCTCPFCGTLGHVSFVARMSVVNVRGVAIEVEESHRECGSCGERFESVKDGDWRAQAYSIYRKRRGMVQPETIVAWRESRDLTPAAMAEILGWGEATLVRYENGSLQSDTHDRQLAELIAS